MAEIKADPFGPMGGMYNIKTHIAQVGAAPPELLWGAGAASPAPRTPPPYRAGHERDPPTPPYRAGHERESPIPPYRASQQREPPTPSYRELPTPPYRELPTPPHRVGHVREARTPTHLEPPTTPALATPPPKKSQLPSPRTVSRPTSMYGLKNPVYKVYDGGDGSLDPRLPSIEEHSSANGVDAKIVRNKTLRTSCVRKVSLEEDRTVRLGSCPNRAGDKRVEYYRKAVDGLPR